MPAMPSMGSWSSGSSKAEGALTPEELESRRAKERARQHGSPAKRKAPSKLQMMREGYESLVCAVVRPPRSRYSIEHDLGPLSLRLDSGVDVEREDFIIANYQGLALQGSIWTPSAAAEGTIKTAVVYLHGNSSCRVDATRTGVLETVGPLDAALVAFDFAGSGLSDGDFVTLGWHERHDVGSVVKYLRERGFERVALWGRSMGAVSALLFAQRYYHSGVPP